MKIGTHALGRAFSLQQGMDPDDTGCVKTPYCHKSQSNGLKFGPRTFDAFAFLISKTKVQRLRKSGSEFSHSLDNRDPCLGATLQSALSTAETIPLTSQVATKAWVPAYQAV